ncbi:MAG: hypothetical protein HIU89_13075 [Proteobacteria bacterium]|nr:hypothetical protein [Pseudomonadota bacterium]
MLRSRGVAAAELEANPGQRPRPQNSLDGLTARLLKEPPVIMLAAVAVAAL